MSTSEGLENLLTDILFIFAKVFRAKLRWESIKCVQNMMENTLTLAKQRLE